MLEALGVGEPIDDQMIVLIWRIGRLDIAMKPWWGADTVFRRAN